MAQLRPSLSSSTVLCWRIVETFPKTNIRIKVLLEKGGIKKMGGNINEKECIHFNLSLQALDRWVHTFFYFHW